MLVVGLTGGIGSGKSTVAKLFAEHGTPIIDTDFIAHELTQPDQAAFTSILKHFGEDLKGPDGFLNRAKLREIVFSDPKQRVWLENLLHPLIRQEMLKKIASLEAPYCIVIIPLLFEVEFYTSINRILVVDTPEHLQIERVMVRDKVPKIQIEAILQAQAKRHDRLVRANDIINNDGTLAHLTAQVEKLHQMYLKM